MPVQDTQDVAQQPHRNTGHRARTPIGGALAAAQRCRHAHVGAPSLQTSSWASARIQGTLPNYPTGTLPNTTTGTLPNYPTVTC
ncbi:hypothetical protein HaLaN_26673 [Haematococcus lacustris]|uniref:Uncharacterized protein n=1 Tax=Haematococcus lacustris TaxID=44745 RepID=A0A6A0A6N4_HAELA|nr:hypothetical protein HaLaN_26673 [Haematococcus lacustris]